MDASKRFAYLFRRYTEKTCTESEKDELFRLLLESEHDETLRKLIEETWAQDFPTRSQDSRTAERILDHIISRHPPLAHPPRLLPYARYAAVLLTLTLASFLTYYFLRPSSHSAPLAVTAPLPPADRCITLPDGSKILLHKDAVLDFDSTFPGKTREVTLHGEAYFDIRHDPRPFIVHTGKIKTTVLGTAFNINAHERDITVTVAKGKVKVENGAGEFSILKRNEQITIDPTQHSLRKTLVDAGEAIAWKKPYLLFNDVPIGEAVSELESRFHVTIHFGNPALAGCPVTASFTEGEPLEQIVKVLSKINNMEYTMIDNKHIELTGEGCK